MKAGYFRRTFILLAAILVAAAIIADMTVTRSVRDSKINALRENLAVQANLIGRHFPFSSPPPLDGLAKELKDVVHARVTIIAPNGLVLGDSDHSSATMDNHRRRIEVQQADLTGTGMTIRHSDTLDEELLYVARKITRGGALLGFVRLSVPLTDLVASVRRLQMRIVIAIAVALLITAVLLFWQIDRIRRLTVQVRDFASSAARGDLGQRLFLHRAGEFEEIAGSLNEMAAALQDEIKSLRDEKAKFETALLGISDGVLLLDRTGRVELANRSFRDLFGIGTEITGRPFLEVVRNHVLADIVREAHEQHRPASAEIEIALPRPLHLQAAALPIIHETLREDRYRGTVVALHDITQLKKLEQVRKDFVANVSHEIKTPITAIQGFAETLLSGALDDRENAQRFLETIRSNSRRINALVDDLLTISKIELGAIAVEKTGVALEDAVDAVMVLLRDKAVRKGISLTTELPAGLGMISADRDRLVQILTNLVDNAIKFTDAGGVVVGAGEENGKTVLFVRDTGSGVSEKHLARLGERFYRVDTARSRSMGGTGLGLAIVKHLVKAHGWEMKIDSAPGKGTTVRIITV